SRLMQSSTMIRRTRVEVDLTAIVGNARTVRALTGTDVCAVVKADRYGHGAVAGGRGGGAGRGGGGVRVGRRGGGGAPCVGGGEAGVTAPVLVMGPSQHGGEDDMVMAGLTPVIGSAEELAPLAAVARRRGRTIEAHLKVDTGMGRLGVSPDEAPGLAVEAAR